MRRPVAIAFPREICDTASRVRCFGAGSQPALSLRVDGFRALERIMIDLARVALTEGVLILALLAAAVLFQLLTGRIRTRGLFEDKTTGKFDPARLQLLVLTFLTAGQLVLDVPVMGERSLFTIPSGALVVLFGGSHGLYLFQKLSQVRAQSKGG